MYKPIIAAILVVFSVGAIADEVKLMCNIPFTVDGFSYVNEIWTFDEAKGMVRGGTDKYITTNKKCANSEGSCDEAFINAEAFGYQHFVDGSYIYRKSISRMDGEYSQSNIRPTGKCVKFTQAF